MKILSIDIGILHLGLIGAEIPDISDREELIKSEEITMCELIDITELIKCKDKNCTLYHNKIVCDYMSHLFKTYQTQFDTADVILIERQPIAGLCAVQELIMMQYRNKSILISPIAMLNFFGILDYEYEIRKIKTEEIAKPYLCGFKNFVFNERRHDLADGFCIMYYYLHLKKKEHENNKIAFQSKERFSKIYLKLSSFVYSD